MGLQDVIKKDNGFREDVGPTGKRFAVIKYWLANGPHHKVVAKLFGLATPIVCVISIA